MSFDAKAFLRTLTEEPGVYRMIGEGDAVLYVGKAKNLKRRVSSYFQRTQLSPRIAIMVGQVVRVETTATRSEAEALILENNLIKRLGPKYNILFRDDKSYPYIALSAGDFPQIYYHRGGFKKGERYFGPFPNSWAVRETLHLMQKIFRLRTCEDTTFSNRSRPCLLHQIHRCTGPCVGLIDKDAYAGDVRLASLFLNGRHGDVVDDLSRRMQAASDELAFEKAVVYRDQIRNLQAVLHKQFVESAKDEDVDVIAALERGGMVCVNLAMIRGGRHLGDRPLFPSNAQGVAPLDALVAFVEQHYLDHPLPGRILVNGDPAVVKEALEEAVEGKVTVVAARYENERAWIGMAENNASLALLAREQESSRGEQRLDALRDAIGLAETPSRIECFDISHTMGEATVASCVVWDGKAMKKSEYRRYNIAGITAGDDYAAMRQALTRRYEKVAAGEGVCPDVILIDGGKGQMGVAKEVLAELGLESIAMFGVAKGESRKPGLETLVFPDGREPVHLRPDAPALHLIQEIRDEAHRFAITGHRARRAKTRNTSRLEDIAGVGPTRRRKLLAAFGGIDGVRNATVEDLCRVEGINRHLAEQIYTSLR
ncbi:excinuclease ABC subunit UvrC [Zoogloea sp.]|uniref:excinuclease ABC subunit UvrC n=1 Tax=Zoogloea sp. TaxID=49181 RepID=UPI0035B39A14